MPPRRRCLLCGRRVFLEPLHWLQHFLDLAADPGCYDRHRDV